MIKKLIKYIHGIDIPEKDIYKFIDGSNVIYMNINDMTRIIYSTEHLIIDGINYKHESFDQLYLELEPDESREIKNMLYNYNAVYVKITINNLGKITNNYIRIFRYGNNFFSDNYSYYLFVKYQEDYKSLGLLLLFIFIVLII